MHKINNLQTKGIEQGDKRILVVANLLPKRLSQVIFRGKNSLFIAQND